MRAAAAFLLAMAMALATPAGAVLSPEEMLKDPALEERARALSRELRCMVCQNQSIDDSDAPLARDLRLLVRERIVSGDSDREVIGFLTERYGDFVLMRPRFGWHTALLWLAPALLLVAGLWTLFAFMRRRRAEVAEPGVLPLSEAERRHLDRILGDQPAISPEKPRTD